MLMRSGSEARNTNSMECAVVAQQVERILGKDEVVSSSLINSSISFFIKENIVKYRTSDIDVVTKKSTLVNESAKRE